MKLWIKLALSVTILVNVVIQITLFSILPRFKANSFTLIGEKLKSIAAASVASINGDEYQKLDFRDSTVTQTPLFNLIRNHLIKVKLNLQLIEDIYTLNLLDENTALFGVMTNAKLYSGHQLLLSNSIAKEALLKCFNEDKCVYTPLYKDQYGQWISGLAPIKNSKNEVVGVVQVDNSANTVYAKIADIENMVLWLRLILFPITILLSIFIAKYISNPISEVSRLINKISQGDYSEHKMIKTSGELKVLTVAAENLRTTILEQQDKIFRTISDLQAAKEKAETSDKMKGEFIALLSHEIRTPLNIILGSIDAIKMELDDKATDDLRMMSSAVKIGSDRLIRTVEMIILYSELLSGSYHKKETYFHIGQLFFNLVESIKDEAVEKGITIHDECTITTTMIKADERLLEEAITQVANNAVKYTSKGEIRFCIYNTQEKEIILEIEDTGVGISEEFMKEIFKPFRQEDMSYTRGYEGNGLGLALAKKCCELNGMDFKISSKKNIGTKIEIHIGHEHFFKI